MLYFDHNATTAVDPQVVEAMLPYLHQLYGNPSSLHRLGRIAKSAIDTAREQVAALVDASPSQIIFTSGGTEANALALQSARGKRLVVSALEHPSVVDNAPQPASLLPSLGNGQINLDALDSLALQRGDTVSLMRANNETGALQPVAALVARLAGRGVLVHSDAVQAAGKIALSFRDLGVDLMTISSHKLYGPKGSGALVCRNPHTLQPLLKGGNQEAGLRAGTENVAAIVGFGKAAELAKSALRTRSLHLHALQQRLEQALKTLAGVVIFAESAERLPNTTQFAIAGTQGEMLVMQLDQHQIAVSSGAACSESSHRISPTLTAMGVTPEQAAAAIRVSLGKDNTTDEIDHFMHCLTQCLSR